MALTDEQRSLLQLLLSGQSYGDIASLLGVSPDEVRSRARGALQTIGGADPDAQVALSDYLLGQADPIGRADAVRQLQGDPAAHALATHLIAHLQLLAPQAQLPEIPAPRGGRAAPAPSPAAPPTAAPGAPTGPAQPPSPEGLSPARSLPTRIAGTMRGIGASKRRAQLAIGLGALGLLVVVGVLAVAGVFGGDDGDGGGGSGGDDGDVVTVALAPPEGGSAASGQAALAQSGDQPFMRVNLSGVAPAPEGRAYIVWLYNSDQAAWPLGFVQATQEGNVIADAPIPQQLLPLLPQFGCVDVSLASRARTQEDINRAIQGQELPRHRGQSVLRGQIPAAPGESAPSGADSNCQGAPPAEGEAEGGAGAEGATDPGSGEGALGE